MPLRFLRVNRGLLALVILALGFGVGGVCSSNLLGRAALGAFSDTVDAMTGTADLQVVASDGAPFPRDVVAQIARRGDVESAVPLVISSAFLMDRGGERLLVQGMDLVDGAAARVYGMGSDVRRTVRNPRVLFPGAVVLTREFAARQRIDDGSIIRLDTPAGRKAFQVRGLIEATGLARLNEGAVALMDLYGAQRAFTGEGMINRIDVVLKRDASADKATADIATTLPPGLRIEQTRNRRDEMQTAVRAERLILNALDFVYAVAACLIATSALGTLFERRTWEIAVLRGLGVRRGAIRTRLVTEALLLGVVAAIVGVPIGIAITYAALPHVTNAVALSINAPTPGATLVLDPGAMLWGIGVGLGTALISGLLPARRVTRAGMAVGMRSRGRELRGGSWAVARWGPVVVAGTTALAISLHLARGSTAWGVAATVLIAILLVLATGVILRALLPVAALPRCATGPAGRLVLHRLARAPRRAALTAAMVALGLGSVLWLWTLARSFEDSLVRFLTDAVRGDLVVSSAHLDSGFLWAATDIALAERVRKVGGVAKAAAVRFTEFKYKGGTYMIEALDPDLVLDPDLGRPRVPGTREEEAWERVAAGTGVLVSTNFARRTGVTSGDEIALDTPTGTHTFDVAGVATHFVSPNGTLVISRSLYERLWNDPKVSRVHLMARAGTDLNELRARINQVLGRTYDLEVRSARQVIDYFAAHVRRAFAGMYVLAVFMLLATLVGVGSALAASVLEQTREIGALRAMGLRRGIVGRMVVIEALAVAGLGLVLAVAFAAAEGLLWVHGTFPLLFGWIIAFQPPYAAASVMAVLTLTLSLVAAGVPARAAARIDPAAALRED